MDKLRIAFITGTLGQGGAERQLFYFLKILKLHGHEPYLLSLTNGEYWQKRIMEINVPVIWIGNHRNRLSRLLSVIRIIAKHPTDIIHSQSYFMNAYGFVAGSVLHKKAIGSIRSNVYYETNGMGLVGGINFYSRNILVANSHSAIENAIKLGKKKEDLYFLPNVVDDIHFAPHADVPCNEKLRIVFVGTLWSPKRVDRIIHIAKKCLDRNICVEFYLYGDGELRESLKNLARESGVYDVNLRFMGAVDDSLVAYQNADILLLTSLFEGTPNVMLEAMSCGLPVISTRVGDVDRYIVDEVNGFIVDPPDEEEKIVDRLITLSNNRELVAKMGKKNRKIIEEEASLQYLYNSLVTLYSTILTKE